MGSPHYEIGRDKFMDRQERARLLKTCRERAEIDEAKGRATWPARYMLVDLALFSGLRVAEIAALKVGDLALKAESPYLTVRRGKGGKKRTVYLDSALVKHLKSYVKHHLHSPDADAPLFPGREGKHSPAITLMKSFKRAIEKAGLPGHFSIHCARHTYATYLLHDTKNLRYVQKQLGHAQIAMTALYSDVMPEENGKLANMIRRDEPDLPAKPGRIAYDTPMPPVQARGMYADTETWNPFKGCRFACTYCVPSFQAQAKRQKHNCQDCYDYVPHQHPERLGRIPSSPIIFVCGNGDISFCDPGYTRKIITGIEDHNRRNPGKTYYFQSKRPEYFTQFLGEFPGNVVLLTTLETNRDEGYGEVSKAPPPSVRYKQLLALDWPRKVLTIEPVMDFDFDVFTAWITALKPEYVWFGFNSKPRSVSLPEPTTEKFEALRRGLDNAGIEVRLKDARLQREAKP